MKIFLHSCRRTGGCCELRLCLVMAVAAVCFAVPASSGDVTAYGYHDHGGMGLAESSRNHSSDIPDNWNTLPCRNFSKVPLPSNSTDSAKFRCTLIRNLTNCVSSSTFIPYLDLIYCVLPSLKPVAIIILVIWLVFLFVSLGSTAEDFFCPALTTISQTLGLSQNIAGVTFLAFGNGAPDIFSAFAAIQQAKHGDAGLAIGALFGAGVFVTTVVVGSICWSQKFALTQRPFLRDVIFYLLAVFMTFTVLWEHRMTTWLAGAFVLVYVVYVVVVIAGRYIYQKIKKRKGGGDIPSPPVHQPGEELGSSPIHSSPIGGDDDEGERTPLLGHVASGSGRHSAINVGSDTATVTPVSSDSIANAGGPPAANGRASRLSREDSRLRSGSFHGQTDHIRRLNSRVDAEDSPGQAATGDTEDVASALRMYRDQVNAMPPHSHVKLRRSTIVVAGALAGLAAPAVPQAQLPGIRRSSSMDHLRITDSAPAATYNTITPKPAKSSSRAKATGGLGSLMDRHVRGESVATPASAMLLKTFLLSISPIDLEAFVAANYFWKVYEIFKSPIQLLLTVTTPVVLLDQEDSNWNRPLNTLHCMTGPVAITLLISGVDSYVAGVVPTVAIVAGAGLLLALLVFFTTRNDAPPRYHRVFAFVGFAVAVVWIYAIANEIVSLLQTLGIYLGISDAILGLTLLAWGNSIGDLVSNTTMARQGFARMAIAACYGGPLLNVLLGIGLASLAKSIKHGGSFCLHFKPVQMVCASFLMASLCLSLLAMLFVLKFNSSKKFAVTLFVFYAIFLGFAFLAEFQVISWSLNYNCT